MNKSSVWLISLCLLTCGAKADFSQAIIFYSGADALTKSQASVLSKYDLIITDRFRYKDVSGNSWRYIKRKNSDSQILLYQLGPIVSKHSDQYRPFYLNNIGRYDEIKNKNIVANANKSPSYFISNILGSNAHVKGYEHYLWLDFSEQHIQDLWFSSTKKDISNSPNVNLTPGNGISASGVSCLILDKVIPGILTAVQKYSTFGSFSI